MALGDVLARLLSLAAFILTLIVIFAGTQSSGALDDIYLIFLDVSKVKTKPGLSQLASDVKFDFFTIHILTYCAGFFDSHGKRNIAMCSKPAFPFAFDLAGALVQNLGLSKSDAESSIDWPYAVISDFAWVSSQAKAVSVLSALNIIIMGVGTLVDGLLCSPGRNGYLFPSLSRALTLTSLLFWLVTTALATFIGIGFVNLLNLHGPLYDLSAAGGLLLMSLIWLSVVLCLIRNLPFLANLRIYRVGISPKADDVEGIGLLDTGK